MAVVIQNSNESRLIYGADVSGTVFKEVSDKVYGRYLSTKKYVSTKTVDSSLYKYYGVKTELSSIFSTLSVPYVDSMTGGYWRGVGMKNNAATLVDPANSNGKGLMPNVVGMGLKDAVYLIENMGLKVTATGRGKVINQSLLAGTPFVKGQKVLLVLN
jgi:cell division protein FtsI (penicillin-binding protein 3)